MIFYSTKVTVFIDDKFSVAEKMTFNPFPHNDTI